MKNNLFTYATKELSQDAFICWILSFAMKDAQNDITLCECAKDFIRYFIPDLNSNEIYLSEAPLKQYKSIDILLTVNDQYKVIIEDKTFSSDHDDQLMRYRNTMEKDFPNHQVICVYYKIGFQSNLSNVYDAGYNVCDRKTILNIIGKHIKSTSNNILIDYYEYLRSLDDEISLFSTLPVEKWNWSQIYGFYDHCKKLVELTEFKADYGYVANPSGGFEAMWIYNGISANINEIHYELYLQCEFRDHSLNICYKASASKGRIDTTIKNQLIWNKIDGQWCNIAKKHGFSKPKRYGSGKTTTLGVFDHPTDTYQNAILAINQAIQNFMELIKELDIEYTIH